MHKATPQDVVVKTNVELIRMKADATSNVRKRTLQTLHSTHAAELRTMINVFTRGSYTVPHLHRIVKEDREIIRIGE